VFEVSIAKPKSRTSKWWEGGTYGEGMVSGWYNDKDKAVRDIVGCNTIGAAGLYLSLNPCHSALISRSDNRLKAGVARTTDPDMLCLRNIYIDIDPRRPKDTNSSNKEHAFSIEHALHVRKVLASHGFPDPLYASSGNGSHLVYQIEPLENTSENQELIREFLYAADSIFSINKNGILLNIDRSVHNPSRIGKIYGTTTQKGDAIEDRPHRMATIIDGPAPEARSKLSIETVKKFTEWAKQQDPKCGQDQKSKKRGEKNKGKSFNPSPDCAFFVDGKLDVEKYLQHYGIATSGKKTHDGSTLYLLKSCVFNSSHSGKESHIRQNEDGQLFYKCFHDSCIGKTWAEARVIISGDDRIGGRPSLNGFNLTDMGNAERFVAMHGNNVRYCHQSGKWFTWDGKRWLEDDVGQVRVLGKQTIRGIFDEAANTDDPDLRKLVIKHANKSEGLGRFTAMITMAEAEEGIPIKPMQLDSDPWLLNCVNGTINLKDGQIQPHTRSNLITKMANVAADPSANCPNWKAFLYRVMDGNQDMIDFLARAIGYTLTGKTSEQCFFLLWGDGQNGKSTFLEIIRLLMGDYAKTASFETFIVRNSETIRNDIAMLRGARYVSASESEKNKQLSEAVVKQLTGEETVTARFLFHENFTFEPEFKIWLGTNYKPHIPGTSHGIWRRIKLIPFNVKIKDEERDKDLKNKLLAELPGILRWATHGCQQWLELGHLGFPKEVQDATDKYRAEQDVLSGFFQERCTINPLAFVTIEALYSDYRHWIEATGERALLSKRRFSTAIEERGFEKRREGSGSPRGWKGIGLAYAEKKQSSGKQSDYKMQASGEDDSEQGGVCIRSCGMCRHFGKSKFSNSPDAGLCHGAPWDGQFPKTLQTKCEGDCWQPKSVEAGRDFG
jgi:P4 family phage/plasmid primase-like protien